MRYLPSLDKDFKPIILEYNDFVAEVKKQPKSNLIEISVERNNGYNYNFSMPAFLDGIGKDEENFRMVERLVKSVLWVVGGYKVYVKGSPVIYEKLKHCYSKVGDRAFDDDFMYTCYLKPFEVVYTDTLPAPKENTLKAGGHTDGCRIGFDAGGSDRKVSAVIDGKVVYSEEVIWNPKTATNPEYHYNGISEALKTAASKMPRVDAIGVSSAGVIIDNKAMVSSLFVGVDKSKYLSEAQNCYKNVIEKDFPNVPYSVANDGDITALAGSMSLGLNAVMGMAMGTSEAVGYINSDGELNGWISELAFCPVDMNQNAPIDEWSTDKGVGCKYFSQDAVIRLAEAGGYEFNENATKAERLVEIQKLLESGDKLAEEIYQNIGIFLGYTIPFYHTFYKMEHLLLMGRVVSGRAGKIIVDNANKVLKDEFADLKVNIILPDEKAKRVGQSIAASSLVNLK